MEISQYQQKCLLLLIIFLMIRNDKEIPQSQTADKPMEFCFDSMHYGLECPV